MRLDAQGDQNQLSEPGRSRKSFDPTGSSSCANAGVSLRRVGLVKRFTDTEKWNDPWFRRLTPDLKCFWFFVLDNCDPSGVWKVDMELANFYISGSLTEEIVLAAMPGRFKQLDQTRWFVSRFIRFQYGELREECRPHMAVIRFLKEHGLLKEYLKGLNTLKDKEKDKEQEKNMEGESEGKPVLFRVRRLFGKRETTAMDTSEQKAWRSAQRLVEQTTEDDWELIEWAYQQSNGSASQFRRKDMATLLNNWNCEIDRAKTWRNGNGSSSMTHDQREQKINSLNKRKSDLLRQYGDFVSDVPEFEQIQKQLEKL